MNLYAESSAVLSWLLDNDSATRVRDLLAEAKIVIASDLTLVECDRVLIRAVHNRMLSEAEAGSRSAELAQVSGSWHLLKIDDEVLERARRPFPVEPLRTLDALHLASALLV